MISTCSLKLCELGLKTLSFSKLLFHVPHLRKWHDHSSSCWNDRPRISSLVPVSSPSNFQHSASHCALSKYLFGHFRPQSLFAWLTAAASSLHASCLSNLRLVLHSTTRVSFWNKTPLWYSYFKSIIGPDWLWNEVQTLKHDFKSLV